MSPLLMATLSARFLPQDEQLKIIGRVQQCADELSKVHENIIMMNCATPYETTATFALLTAEQLAGHAEDQKELDTLINIFCEHLKSFAQQTYNAVKSGEATLVARGFSTEN
jgi:hypothetical protein